jgi:hypothetical protein
MIDRITAAVLCFALAGTVAAQDKKPPAPQGKPAAEAKAPAEMFVIAKTGDKFEVMSKTDLEAKKKKAAEDFKASKEAWKKEKDAAEAAHKKLDKPEPKEATIEVKPGEYPTKEAAEAELKKMQADKDKAKKPEPAKKDAPPAGSGHKGH